MQFADVVSEDILALSPVPYIGNRIDLGEISNQTYRDNDNRPLILAMDSDEEFCVQKETADWQLKNCVDGLYGDKFCSLSSVDMVRLPEKLDNINKYVSDNNQMVLCSSVSYNVACNVNSSLDCSLIRQSCSVANRHANVAGQLVIGDAVKKQVNDDSILVSGCGIRCC